MTHKLKESERGIWKDFVINVENSCYDKKSKIRVFSKYSALKPEIILVANKRINLADVLLPYYKPTDNTKQVAMLHHRYMKRSHKDKNCLKIPCMVNAKNYKAKKFL